MLCSGKLTNWLTWQPRGCPWTVNDRVDWDQRDCCTRAGCNHSQCLTYTSTQLSWAMQPHNDAQTHVSHTDSTTLSTVSQVCDAPVPRNRSASQKVSPTANLWMIEIRRGRKSSLSKAAGGWYVITASEIKSPGGKNSKVVFRSLSAHNRTN